jgi:hypothetical protein
LPAASPQYEEGSYTDGGVVTNFKTLSVTKIQLLILNGQDEALANAQNAQAIRSFIQAGGGVLIGAQGWYWASSKPITAHPNNVLTSPMGIVVTGELVTKQVVRVGPWRESPG